MGKITGNPVEKKILEDLMPTFDSGIASKTMVDSILMKDDMEAYAPSPGDIDIQIKSVIDRSCFRIRFSLPVLLHFHHATRNLHRIQVFYKKQSGSFPIGLFPAYNCNLNNLTLLRTYQKTSEWSNLYDANKDEDYFCQLFDNSKNEPMEQSSLNFLLQNDSVAKPVTEDSSKLVNDCFESQYWRPPSYYAYSFIHDFIYHSHSKISGLQGVYKTIVKIVDVGQKRYEMREGSSTIRYAHAMARILCQNDELLSFSTAKLLISEPAASQLSPDDVADCVLSKPVGRGRTSGPPMIRGVVRKINGFDLGQIISLVIWRGWQKGEQTSVCSVGPSEQVSKNTLSFIENHRGVFDDGRWTEHFERRFDSALAGLHPLILEHNSTVYDMPPPLVSYVLARNIPVLGNRHDLLDFLEFVDTMDPRRPFDKARLRMSQAAKKVQSGPCVSKWGLILREIPRVANRIVYSRIFSKHVM